MVALDSLYHLATETAVHINYAAVKFTIIFLVVFLVAHWVGKSVVDGIFTSMAGPVLFYIYYIFANPTLNRQIFRIDDNFWYIFIHIAALLVAYFVVYRAWVLKKVSGFTKSISFAVILSLCIYGLDAGYQLLHVQFTTHDEELTARTLNFYSSILLAVLLFVLLLLSDFFIKSKKTGMTIIVIGTAILIYFIGHDPQRILAGAPGAFILLYINHIYARRK